MGLWAAIYKAINNNIKHPLNEQITDREFNVGQLITTPQSWTVPKSGIYKIVCVGAGGKAIRVFAGAGGGVVIEKAILTKGDNFNITFPTRTGNSADGYSTITTDAFFGELCGAYGALGSNTGGGFVTNGMVYKGLKGEISSANNYVANGGSVGLYDRKYISEAEPAQTATLYTATGGNGLFGGKKMSYSRLSNGIVNTFAGGAGGYGGGASVAGVDTQGIEGDACVYIELVEEL